MKPLCVDKQGSDATRQCQDFARGNGEVWPVLIIGYEMFRKHAKTLNGGGTYRLLVADEGHRLKSSQGNQTTNAIKACQADAKLILTGTPIQNDLLEFFALSNLVNPGMLNDKASFRRLFQRPIEKGNEKGCSEAERLLSEQRMAELHRQTAQFVLRRTSSVVAKFLPPKTSYTVFCRPSPLQAALYRQLVAGARLDNSVLQRLNCMRRLCNHPSLVFKDCAKAHAESGASTPSCLALPHAPRRSFERS